MAIVKACLVGNTIKNTGKECDIVMGATAMIIAAPLSLQITDEDLEDPITFLETKIHASSTSRVYPLFGQKAPIRTITNNTEADILVTMDDGLQVFLRYGIYNRIFETTSGGLCYASALQSLNRSGYGIIEIDQEGKMLLRKNSNGTYGALIADFMYAPSPVLADFKNTPYKNRFQYSFTPVELVNNGVVFDGAVSLLSLMGLIDAEITSAAAATTTALKISVKTECAQTDLIELLGADLGTNEDNFIVKDDAGVVQVISGATIVGGAINLAGTFVSSETYTVTGAAPSVWHTNGASGYDASASTVSITIP